jgi:hypothetical protein
MSCPALQPLMRDAARDRLDESQTATVAAHLVDCASCRILLDEELLLDRLLEEWLCQLEPTSKSVSTNLCLRRNHGTLLSTRRSFFGERERPTRRCNSVEGSMVSTVHSPRGRHEIHCHSSN